MRQATAVIGAPTDRFFIHAYPNIPYITFCGSMHDHALPIAAKRHAAAKNVQASRLFKYADELQAGSVVKIHSARRHQDELFPIGQPGDRFDRTTTANDTWQVMSFLPAFVHARGGARGDRQ